MAELNIIGATEQNRYYPYQNAFRVTRNSFWQAGQDSFTSPPAQSPDLFTSMTNAEPVLQGDIQRRRGYTLLSTITPTAPFNESYAYRNELTEDHRLVWTSPSAVVATDEAGGLRNNPLFTPSLTASAVRMVLSRNYGYFADGAPADYLKWDGSANAGNLTNWGIAVQANAASTFGPNNGGTYANVNFASAGTAWSPGTSLPSSVTLTAFSDSKYLWATNFGFAATPTGGFVTGVVVNITGSQTEITQSALGVWLIKGGVAVGTEHSGILPIAGGTLELGSSVDVWGTSLLGSDVNGSTFGVGIVAGSDLGSAFTITAVTITIYMSGSTITLGSPTGTGITLISGRVYTVVFQNATAGTTSGLYPFSASTGPLTNQGQPLSGLPVHTDPQVDTKLLLATADGGDETTLYLVTSLPNATTSYSDTTPDSALLTQPIFQQTDQNGNLHGVANNNPPPVLTFPIKHKGRLYGTIGPTLYFSKNLNDVTTSTGTITGKWEEAWPATYSLDVSEVAETVSGLLSDGQTLYIATDASIRRLIGDSPDNFQEPEVIFNHAGVINQEVWKVVYAESQPVGSMWLTPDNRVMLSDFNSYQDVGAPIQDVLNSINRAVVQTVSHACAVAKGPAEYYMLYIPTGSATTPNTVCVFNMRTKKWCIWNPTDRITTSLFNITTTGAPQWLFAAPANNYFWNDAVNVDRSANTPVSYPVTLATSWLDFGDAGLTKSINKIVLDTLDSNLTVGVTGVNKVSAIPSGVSNVLLPVPIAQETFGDLFVPMLGSIGGFRWFQLTFTSPAGTTGKVLGSFDIEAVPSMRI